MSKILITGGCGFIGTNISLYALKRGYKIVAFDSLIRGNTEKNAALLEKEGVEIIRGDIRNTEDFDKIPRVDAIIHLASNPGIRMSIQYSFYDFSVNAYATLNVLEYSRKNGKIPVIFASTNKIYSEEINEVPVRKIDTRYEWNFNNLEKSKLRKAVKDGIGKSGINEDFPMDSSGRYPHTPYGASKCTGDLYCQEYFHIFQIPTVVNRMSCIYGLHQKGVEDQGWIDWFVRAKVVTGEINVYGDGKQVRDALFGSDVAEVYIKELENIDKIKGQVFNLGGGTENTVSVIEVLNYLNSKDGKKIKIIYRDWRAADQKIYISDITKISRTLNWEPKISPFEGIDKILKQYTDELN